MQFSDPTCLKAKYSKAIGAYLGTLQSWRDGCQVEYPDDRCARVCVCVTDALVLRICVRGVLCVCVVGVWGARRRGRARVLHLGCLGWLRRGCCGVGGGSVPSAPCTVQPEQ